jgi:hypothetical protein
MADNVDMLAQLSLNAAAVSGLTVLSLDMDVGNGKVAEMTPHSQDYVRFRTSSRGNLVVNDNFLEPIFRNWTTGGPWQNDADPKPNLRKQTNC